MGVISKGTTTPKNVFGKGQSAKSEMGQVSKVAGGGVDSGSGVGCCKPSKKK